MGNMSYCRFRNTKSDLKDCLSHINDDDLQRAEAEARDDLIELCQRVVDRAES